MIKRIAFTASFFLIGGFGLINGVCLAFQANDQPDEQEAAKLDEIQFFEKSIRPLLIEKCYPCHSADAGQVEGDLLLDSRQGIAAGGASGEVISGTDAAASLLIRAVRWDDLSLQMPPDGRLSEQEIAALEQWIALGAPDPREATSTSTPSKERVIDWEEGRRWWSFQPLPSIEHADGHERLPIKELASPDAAASQEAAADAQRESGERNGLLGLSPGQKIDDFVMAELAQHQLSPSPAASRETLIRRAYLDLTGLRPSYDQVQTFVNDDSPEAYARLVDHLLASPEYGQRWGRYWLDVVRYGEDNFTGEATTPNFPFAWRYRDWVIGAINRDLPYDQFVKLQLAADLMPDVARSDMVALGFLGAAPSYHKDGRLSKDVVETLYTDDWDERVDAVSRGLLGLTVACARCHDHKFDPISAADYYSFAGVFASTVQGPRPLRKIDAAAETKFMVDSQRIFYLSYAARLLRDDPGSKPVEAREKVLRYRAEMEAIQEENSALRDTHPELYEHLSRLARKPKPYPDEVQDDGEDKEEDSGRRERRGRRGRDASEAPIFQAVYDAGFYVDGSDPDFTMLDIRPGQARDLAILGGGNVTRPGAIAPRGFLSVLAQGDAKFEHGSGRLELAERIFSDAAPLAARVIVNRVWGWHFGQGLVATPSDFGTQGERPSHPKLLDDLAARFVQHGYSLKWLHREIMLSATYRQASNPRSEAIAIDPSNRWLWRMNPRRLDVEAYRDCLLQASGNLDREASGPSDDLDRSNRRTVYSQINRGRPATLLQLYDFPSPKLHSPQRESTTSPLQQLFIMNSDFMRQQAQALVARAKSAIDQAPGPNDDQVDLGSESVDSDNDQSRDTDAAANEDASNGWADAFDPQNRDAIVQSLYAAVFGRDASERELQIAAQFLEQGTLTQYAQALLASNEVIFWP